MSNNRQAPSNDELEIAEAQNPLVDILYDFTAQALTTRIGHFIYHRTDSFLGIVEKTAKWSLPQPAPSTEVQEEEETKVNTISPPPLVRPLPWILFLPALIALRLIRVWLSFIALLLGRQPVYPSTMVTFLQNRRRKLRALKYRGQRLQRINRAEQEANENEEDNEDLNKQTQSTWLSRITLPLRYIICRSTVRSSARATTTIHGQHRHHHHHHHHHHQNQKQKEESADRQSRGEEDEQQQEKRQATKKRSHKERDEGDSESSMEGATVDELLERYADAGDSSFNVSDASSPDSDSFLSDSDNAKTEEPQPQPAPQQNGASQKPTPKESNGHATTPPKEPAAAAATTPEESQQPEKPKRKSSLNVDSSKPEEKQTAKQSTDGKPSGNGEVAPGKEPQKKSESSKKSKPEEKTTQVQPEPEHRKHAASEDGSVEHKPKIKKQQPVEGSPTSDNQNAPKAQSPASMNEVKTNFQQKNKSQHQQPQQQNQPQQQQQQHHQQQHHSNGGEKKKHKKHQHHHQQQQHNQQQQQQQQQQQHHHPQ